MIKENTGSDSGSDSDSCDSKEDDWEKIDYNVIKTESLPRMNFEEKQYSEEAKDLKKFRMVIDDSSNPCCRVRFIFKKKKNKKNCNWI